MTLLLIAITITCTALFLVIYHHVGYPIILRKISAKKNSTAQELRAKKYYEATKKEYNLPFISILIPAYNEAEFIAEKIRNLACLDYPSNRFEVILAIDGACDDTLTEALKAHQEKYCKDLRLRILDFKQNRGKVAILNTMVPRLKSDIIALSDVSSLVSIDALKVAAQRFEDPQVGAINGNYRLLNPGSAGEAKYWQYQSAIKKGEEALGSVLGAHGAFYLIRRELFHALPENTINDDFIIPMRIVQKNYRVIYESRLNSVELEQASTDQDWQRRLRIGFGNAQQLSLLRGLFHPKYGGVAFAFFSGKGLRVAMPFLMIISFIGSWLLAYLPIFFVLAISQSIVYGIALTLQVCHPKKPHKLLQTIHYLIAGHTANLIGCMRYITGKKKIQW